MSNRRITLEIPENGPIVVTYEAEINGSHISLMGTASFTESIAEIELNLLRRHKSRMETAVGAAETLYGLTRN